MDFKHIFKRGAEADLPVLDDGEPAITTDENGNKKFWLGSANGNIPFSTKDDLEAFVGTEIGVVNALLAEIAKNINNPFGLGLDGKEEIDVSDLMQQYLDLSINSGFKKITFPKGVYIQSKPLDVSVDDLDLDFNGSTVKWRGIANLNNSNLRTQGVVNVHGTLGSSANVVEFVPKEELFNISLDGDSYISSTLGSKVKTDNDSIFAVGDYVNLYIETGTNTVDTLLPQAKVICEIIDITSDGYIVLDYYSPFDWTGTTVTGTLTKVTPRKNVEVKNLSIEDEVVVSANYKTDGQRETFVAGVSFLYTEGCRAENIKGKNTKFPVVINRYSHDFYGKDIKVNKPAIYDGGEGYALQLIFCNKVRVENISGIRERHNVDISAGAFFHILNAHSNRPKAIPFDMHGICEHSIVWENCIGGVGMTNGIAEFPCMVDNVRFINHKGVVTCGGSDSYASNIEFEGGEIRLLNYHALSTIFHNVEITWDTRATNYDLTPNKRGKTNTSKFIVDGGTFVVSSTSSVGLFTVEYDIFSLDDCDISVDTTFTGVFTCRVRGVSAFDLKNSKINGLERFLFSYLEAKDTHINIDNNSYFYNGDKAGRSIAEFATMSGCNVFLDVNNVKTLYTHASYLNFILIAESNGNQAGTNFYVTGNGNKLIGTQPTSIHAYLYKPATGTISHSLVGNIIKNYSGSTLDATTNKLI